MFKRVAGGLLAVGLLASGGVGPIGSAEAAGGPPPIRTTGTNAVPACATPERMMAFIRDRNPQLMPQFQGIAAYYRQHGERWGVRWDYAIFQMILETNALKFRRPDGKRGDVHERQNNFAGLGATGGGVPGDVYPDVSTGVRAQIEHLVAYSGERVPNPVGARTRLKQDDIIFASRKLGRPVTFADLRNRWAADRNYARSIESVANAFREGYCRGGGRAVPAEAAALPWAGQPSQAPRPPAPSPAGRRSAFAETASGLQSGAPRPQERVAARAPMPPMPAGAAGEARAAPGACRILTASYGGETTVLIRAPVGTETHYTLLTVLEGFETNLTRSYVSQHAPGGVAIGSFRTRAEAMDRARSLCR